MFETQICGENKSLFIFLLFLTLHAVCLKMKHNPTMRISLLLLFLQLKLMVTSPAFLPSSPFLELSEV